MKTRKIIYSLSCLIALSASSSAATKPTAFLRTKDEKSYYIAVKADPPLWKGDALQAIDVAKDVIASVYQKGRLIPTVIVPSNNVPLDIAGADFTIKISDSDVLKGNFDPLQLVVHKYPISNGQTSQFLVDVTTEISPSLTQESGNCYGGFPLEVTLNKDVDASDYTGQRFETLLKYMRDHDPEVQVESQTAGAVETRQLKSGSTFFGNHKTDHRFYECLILAKNPPSGNYDIKFTYPQDAPIELRKPFLKTDVANASHAATPLSLDQGNVGKRTLEQNFDVGVQFGSSVSNKTIKNAAGMDVTVRERDSRGTLDLRLAPLLNYLSLPDSRSTTFKFLTPFLIDARISTGKISKDNISLNRIVIGSEYEIRHYTNSTTFPAYQRYIFSFRNASDRDFKQAEWKVGFEFQPVFSSLNRPLRFCRQSPVRVLDPDPKRAPKDFPATIGFGGQFLPLLGIEMGKTWRNKSSFAAIEKTNFVRRFYFGGTLTLDLTAYVKVSIKNITYVRGETKEDRLHNYFLSSIEAPFPSITRDASSSAFFSFERGGQAPFATPDVNAVRVGYRVQWGGWFARLR